MQQEKALLVEGWASHWDHVVKGTMLENVV